MATIVLPGKKSLTIAGGQTLADLKQQGLVPPACSLVRKDPQTGAVQQLQETDPVAGEDLIYAVPRHIQGSAGRGVSGVSHSGPAQRKQ